MAQSVGRTKKSAKISEALQRDLAMYAFAARAAGVSVLALAATAEAQVVYTPAQQRIGLDQKMLVDLNHDGIADIAIRENGISRELHESNSLQALARSSGGGVKIGAYWPLAAAMPGGSVVSPGNNFLVHIPAVMFHDTVYLSYYYFGSWGFDCQRHYLGIRFAIDGQEHYGWARLTVRVNNFAQDIEALLTGYAYESTPNKAIIAGDEGNGKVDHADWAPSCGVPEEEQRRKPVTLGGLALGSSGFVS